jgi:hypothetical protein
MENHIQIMIIDQTKLQWDRWRNGGYVWREREWLEKGWDDEASPGSEAYLVIPSCWEHPNFDNMDDSDFPSAPHSYRPMENKTILKSFVNTQITKEGIMLFVEKFGHLGIPKFHRHDGVVPVFGEALGDWIREINKIKNVLVHWSIVRSKDELKGDVHHLQAHMGVLFPWMDVSEEYMRLLNVGLVLPYDPYNQKISRLSQITQAINSGLINRIQPVAEINETVDGISFTLAPTTLIGAIWLQVAEVVSPKSRTKICGYCGELFEAKNMKAEYCKTSHQQMAHRKRKQLRGDD